MVARTSNNRCYETLVGDFLIIIVRPRKSAIEYLIIDCEGGEKDLRKTALGASSPAKPALHIPELG